MLMGRSRRVTSARPATTKGCRVVQWQCGGRSALSALIFGVGPLLAASAVAINRHNLDLLCDDRQAAGHAEKLQGRQTFLCGGLNRGTTLSGQISPSYASTNRRGKCTTYRAVCGKRATLLDNADRASRKPRCGLELNSGWNVKWPAIRAWGQYHSRILDRWAANTGRLEGATAEKAVPFPCAARRSVVLRLAELTCMTTSRGAK
jgi:hypothetical protein